MHLRMQWQSCVEYRRVAAATLLTIVMWGVNQACCDQPPSPTTSPDPEAATNSEAVAGYREREARASEAEGSTGGQSPEEREGVSDEGPGSVPGLHALTEQQRPSDRWRTRRSKCTSAH